MGVDMKAKISLGAIELIAETELDGQILKSMLNETYKANSIITRPFGKDKNKYHYGALYLDKVADIKITEIPANPNHRYRREKDESTN